MTEEVLFRSEQKMSRDEIAGYLRDIADKFESDSGFDLSSGTQSITVNPGENPELELKVEQEEESSGTETSLEIEIEWSDSEDSGLEIS